MKDESNFQRGCTQVIEGLTPGIRRQHRSGFVLDYDFLVYNHVQTLSREWLSFVVNGHNYFPSYRMTTLHQFPLQRQGVNVLQETVPKPVVDLVKRPNDPCGRSSLE